eukprot:m.322472 g.322472  ORF g.322472 m.322472 type:complete len:116 (+) comp20352_c0_seq2:469-816(+)
MSETGFLQWVEQLLVATVWIWVEITPDDDAAFSILTAHFRYLLHNTRLVTPMGQVCVYQGHVSVLQPQNPALPVPVCVTMQYKIQYCTTVGLLSEKVFRGQPANTFSWQRNLRIN